MPLADHKLSDIVERPKFKAMPEEEQRLRKIRWIQDKTVQLRDRFGDQFQPQQLVEALNEKGLINDLVPEQVDLPGDKVADKVKGVISRIGSEAGAVRALEAGARTVEKVGDTVFQKLERKIIEKGIELRNRFPEAFREEAFNPRLLSTDPAVKEAAFEAEIQKRLGNTLGTKIKTASRAVIDSTKERLQETGAIARLQEDAQEGFLSVNNVANMINQSLPIMGTAALGIIAGGPGLAIGINTPILGGFSAEELDQTDMSEPEKLGRILVSGLAQSTLEQIVPARLLKTKNFTGIGNVVQTVILEGVTEAAQKAIELTATQANSVSDIAKILSDPDNLKAIYQEFLGGALLGGVFGGTQQASLFLVEKVKQDRQKGEIPDADNRQEQTETQPRSGTLAPQQIAEGQGRVDETGEQGPPGQRALQRDRSDQEVAVEVAEDQTGVSEDEIRVQVSKDVSEVFRAAKPVTTAEGRIESEKDIQNPVLKSNIKHQGPYKEVSELPSPSDFKKRVTDAAKDGKLVGDRLIAPISSRMKRIKPVLKKSIRKHSFQELNRTQESLTKVVPLLKGLKKIKKVAQGDYKALALALFNGDRAKAREIFRFYNLGKEFDKLGKILEDLRQEAIDSGLEVGKVKNYFPRIVKDTGEYLAILRNRGQFTPIDLALERKRNSLGRDLTAVEEEEVVSVLLRGFGNDRISFKSNNATESRVFPEILPTDLQYYHDPETALDLYITRIHKTVEGRKFFGLNKDNKGADTSQDIISEHVRTLIKNEEITESQAQEIQGMLSALFGNKGPTPFVRAFKNIEYVDTLASVISAMTQLEDISIAIARSGLVNSIVGFSKGLSKRGVTARDIGITKISHEFVEVASNSQKFLELMFKITGFNMVDQLGKETVINAKLRKLQQEGKAKKFSKSSLELMDQVLNAQEKAQAITDLQNDVLSTPVKMLIFNELLEVQPVAASEMPEIYLGSSNGKIFYMLKSFMLKRLDLWRSEVIDRAKNGDVKGALEQVVRMSLALVIGGMGVDELKNFLLGREVSLSDTVVNNLVKATGLSKFFVYEVRREGVFKGIVKQILPPGKIIDNLGKDVFQFLKTGSLTEKKFSTSSIPVVGRLYFWWFGRGRDIIERDNKRKLVEKYDIDLRKINDTRQKISTMPKQDREDFLSLLTPKQKKRLRL